MQSAADERRLTPIKGLGLGGDRGLEARAMSAADEPLMAGKPATLNHEKGLEEEGVRCRRRETFHSNAECADERVGLGWGSGSFGVGIGDLKANAIRRRLTPINADKRAGFGWGSGIRSKGNGRR